MTTPRLTEHARRRCREMGLSTKAAKRAFRNGVLEYRGSDSTGETRLRIDPVSGLAVSYVPGAPGESPIIITVLWREPFVRADAS
jgi:hypothetical protein